MNKLNGSRVSSFEALLSILMLMAPMAIEAGVGKAKDIYPDPSIARDQIKSALTQASKSHKRIILDFGGNWCGDCLALNNYFHEEPNASILDANFILVDVNIGKWDRNKDIAKRYGVPLEKGVPALAVLDSNGQILFSQKNGEFESMRSLQPSELTKFLNRWKPQ